MSFVKNKSLYTLDKFLSFSPARNSNTQSHTHTCQLSHVAVGLGFGDGAHELQRRVD
jgi:hypothetical protein